jgi:hypothetical protein
MSKADPTKPEIHGAEHDPGGNDPITISKFWPIGSVYISIVATNPSDLMGFGTWSAFGAGRVLVGLDSEDPDFDTAEEEGGAKSRNTDVAGVGATARGSTASTLTLKAHVHPVNVVQPYIVVYMWKRTA